MMPQLGTRFVVPFELDVADVDRVSGGNAGTVELTLDAHLRQVALEAVRGLGIVGVCLRRHPLDTPADDSEALTLALDGEDIWPRREAMEDDARGFGGPPELRGVGQEFGQFAHQVVDARLLLG